MAEFTADLQTIIPPFFDNILPSMEQLINNHHHLIPDHQLNPSALDYYSAFSFNTWGPEFQGNFHTFVNHDNIIDPNDELAPSAAAAHHPLVAAGNESQYLKESKNKRTAMDDASYSSSGLSTPTVSETGVKTKMSLGRGKRAKKNEKEEDVKPKEVVHVRARRGQATDSHSLAERVRRGKINERLRCLQDIVPGCSKTMGMAGMLDEIINYVQSLQNQVEFLSMKLTAASNFYDFNSETDDIETMQRAKVYEAAEFQMLKREGHGGVGSCFHSTWSP